MSLNILIPSPNCVIIIMIPARVLGLSQSTDINERPDKKLVARFLFGPLLHQETGKQVTGFLVACSRSPGGAGSLYGVEGGVSRRGQRWLGVLPTLCDAVVEHTQ